jgi:hypothetical protein
MLQKLVWPYSGEGFKTRVFIKIRFFAETELNPTQCFLPSRCQIIMLFCRISMLCRLYMLDTFFKQPLPSSIWNLTGLQELSLDWGLTAESTCTEELGGLVELRVLNLRLDARSGSVGGARRPWSVIELPPSMGKLTGLEKLHLEVLSSAHQITPDFLLPEEIGEMEGLRELSLKSCGAKELPLSIQKLTGLEKQSLQCCRNIEALPQGMESMVGLRLLNLAGCRLGDAGASFIAKILRTNHSI